MARLPAEEKLDQLKRAYDRRDFAETERIARGFTRKWPAFGPGWSFLSAALHARGKLDKAAQAYQRALRLSPDRADLHDNFGALLVQQGRLDQAVDHFRESVRLDPGSARSRSNLALALTAKAAWADAAEHARRAVTLDPASASAYNILGNALKGLGRLDEARTAYLQAVSRQPHYAKAHCNLAAVLTSLGSAGEAEQHYGLAIRSRPDYVKAHLGLGNLLAMLGRMEEAEQAYRRTLSINPALAEAHRYLCWIRTFREPDEDLSKVEALLADRSVPDHDKAQLHYAAGKAYQDIGQPGRAFEHFEKGAGLRRRQFTYDVADDESLFRRITSACGNEQLPLPRPASAAPVPVFIVGIPRSGTTLVEQIIGAHPDAASLGELSALDDAVAELDAGEGKAYPEWVDKVGERELAGLASAYARSARLPTVGTRIFTDKTPSNFKYLGIILAALPGARIVHVRRSPLDTCLSCFTQYFSSYVPYSYDLAELGRYYRAYHELMGHWRRILPEGAMLEVEYETLTREPERQSRAIVDFCGLEWQDECLGFEDTKRLVQTASVAQVRKPVSRAAVGRWRAYEAHLAPLREALGELAW